MTASESPLNAIDVLGTVSNITVNGDGADLTIWLITVPA
jgi:hypothetical protein